MGDLRSKLERTETDAPRKVPAAERESRKVVLRNRLEPGLMLEGELDPANCVVDRFVQMLEDNVVEWVPWDEVPKRDQELTTGQVKRKWLADNLGMVREKAVKVDPAADTSSALRISWALQRRGLSLELAGLMNFEAHEKLRNKLLGALTRDVPDDRYAAASIEQVRNADKEAWRLMSKKCRLGLKAATAADPPPMQAALDEILNSMEFNLALMPLPKASGGPRGGGNGKDDRDDGARNLATKKSRAQRRTGQVDSLKKQLAEAKGSGRAATPPPSNPGRQATAKAASARTAPMPRALLGGVAQTANGDRICFGWNLGSCTAAEAGARCPKGMHVCTKAGCQGRHKASECSQ